MVKKPSKVILISVGAFIAGAAIGGGSSYVLQTSNENAADRLVAVDGTTSIVPGVNSVPTISQSDASLPEGTLSPSDVSKQAYLYLDKDIKVKGQLIQVSEGKYSLVGLNEKQPLGISVDFSKAGVNPKDYVVSSTTSNDAKAPSTLSPITVSGKIVETKAQDISTFTLQAIKVEK